jgi:FkbM family methyltransferase
MLSNWSKRIIKKLFEDLGLEISRAKKSASVDLHTALLRFHGCNPIRQILDVGANVGQSALDFSKLFPEAKIDSIEPYSVAFAALKEASQGLPNVTPHNLAIGNSAGQTSLRLHKAAVTNSVLAPATCAVGLLGNELLETTGHELVRMETIEQFCKDQAIDTIDLLKSDTQGYEDRVLESCGKLLTPSKIRLLMIEVLFFEHYYYQGDFGRIYTMLLEKNYKLYSLYNLHSTTTTGYMWADALFVPRESCYECGP